VWINFRRGIETANFDGGLMKYSGTQLMESAPVSQAIIRLALPMMAAMVAQAIYNMSDMFFIGQTGDPVMVAAVSLVFPIFMLSQALGNMFATGSSSYISRMLGLRNTEESKNTSSVCFYLPLITGLLLTVLLWDFKIPMAAIIVFISFLAQVIGAVYGIGGSVLFQGCLATYKGNYGSN
jgi:Na+-driven multidrug efflux pump